MVVMMSQGASRLIAMGTEARAKRPYHYRCLLGQDQLLRIHGLLDKWLFLRP